MGKTSTPQIVDPAYKNPEDAARHDEGTDDLTVGQVVDIFSQDLKKRGISFVTPDDPTGDPAWIEIITTTYGTLQNLKD